MNRITLSILRIIIILALIVGLSNCTPINSNNNDHFTEDGYLIRDTTESSFQMELPSMVKFYVEVSGSMNGFLRANRPTQFKTDVWEVISSFAPLSKEVTILTDEGDQGAVYSCEGFRSSMNTGAFISTASTKVPLMINTIIENLNTDSNEVAVLISDMKYSPVGASAPAVLLEQYATDINKIIGEFGQSISLVAATSDYVDSNGNIIASRSPYYYVILGRQENVAQMRNIISFLLQEKGDFVDNIESGFNYGRAKYAFGISNKCFQLGNEPTFLGYEEHDDQDTCTIKLKVPLQDYRWIIRNPAVFRESLNITSQYGTEVKLGDIVMNLHDITGKDKRINREDTAIVDIKVFNMPMESEVLEWNLDLPSMNTALLQEFIENATEENDPTKSYSVKDFLKGVFSGGVVVHEMVPNYILISKQE